MSAVAEINGSASLLLKVKLIPKGAFKSRTLLFEFQTNTHANF